jgi:hypothetical protein
MDALEELGKYFVTRDNILHCLSRALCAHTSSDTRVDIPREGH